MPLKFLKVKEASGDSICNSRMAANLMAEEAKADRECFWVLHLNTKNRIIEKELVSIGTVNSSLVHPREVFKKAILNGASSIITVHNHPSNDITPSQDDRNIWKRLDETGKIVGIQVLDHIIITPKGEYFSGKENIVRNRKEN
jgi:DNA repair protein RadC